MKVVTGPYVFDSDKTPLKLLMDDQEKSMIASMAANNYNFAIGGDDTTINHLKNLVQVQSRFVVIDLETTGLNASEDRILEIGCVELIDGVMGNSLELRVNPEGYPISEQATAVNGITEADVADAPVFADIVQTVEDFIGESPIVFHGANFDMNFLRSAYYRMNRDFKYIDPTMVYCTMYAGRKAFKGIRRTLDSMCDLYGIDRSHRTTHGALVDAKLTAQLFVAMGKPHKFN